MFPATVSAHDTGSTFLKLTVEEERLSGRWEINAHDIVEAVFGEETSSFDPQDSRWRSKALPYALERLRLEADGIHAGFKLEETSLDWAPSPQGTNWVLSFSVTNESAPSVLDVEYRLFFERWPEHRGLLQLETATATQTALFSPGHSRQRFELGAQAGWRQFWQFGWEGVWHIWIGIDHILFLLALLLPAVLQRETGEWQAVASFKLAALNVVKIVTSFTVAHSVTLALAALELVRLPGRGVESVIAASVAVAAANNLRPFFQGKAWIVAFLFGLIHGFGFANVLSELGLPRHALLVSLVGFNLGVEAGQLAIVAVYLPMACLLRSTAVYRRVVLGGGSWIILLIAGAWFLERALGYELLPF